MFRMNSAESNLKKSPAKHSNRNDLGGEAPFWDLLQFLMILGFAFLWILDSFIFQFSILLANRVDGLILFALGMPLIVLGTFMIARGLHVVFHEVRDPPSVVKTGLFARTRHPVYFGIQLIYIGMVVTTSSLLSLGAWFIIFLVYNQYTNHEEALLLEKFGDEYRDYMKKVPKWFPRLRVPNSGS